MTGLNDTNNVYTNSPPLRRNAFQAALQLLLWLLFHPSAWRHHLAHIDPALPPNFGLTDLRQSHWRNPVLRRTLLVGYGWLPALAALAVGPILWSIGVTGPVILLGMAITLIFGVGLGTISSLVVGLPVSFIFGPTGGAGMGIGAGLWLTLEISSGRATGSPTDVLVDTFIFGAAFGIVFGVSEQLFRNSLSLLGQSRSYSLFKWIGVIGGGILASGLYTFLMGYTLASRPGMLFAVGLAATLVAGGAVALGRDPLAGLIVGLALSFSLALAMFTPGDSVLGPTLFSAAILPIFIITERSTGPLPAAVSSALGGGSGWVASTIIANNLPFWPLFPLSFLTILVGLTIFRWRPLLLYPFETSLNAWLRYRDGRRPPGQAAYLRWHAAFWDEQQVLPLFGLPEHLLLVLEQNPAEGQAALTYLSHSRQRWAAQSAQIELDARQLEGCTSVTSIGRIHRNSAAGALSGPASALLRSFRRISQDVDAALAQSSAYNQRLALSAIEDRLDGLLRELTRSSERHSLRFRPIAQQWRRVVADHIRGLVEAVELRQEIDSPYVIGVPLTDQQEIFVGRTDISARIEQLLLDRRRPPLLLVGQRRMGKTSLLNNLGRLLPSTIVPLFIDLQGPASHAQDHAGFFYNIARGMSQSARKQSELDLPPLSREQLAIDPFTSFDEWLDEVEASLGEHTALVALDEFEALESAIRRGRLDEQDLLGMLRHLIQHRPRFKILLTSSRGLDELRRWASYMINIQVVHLGYLSEAEARRLIEQPVTGFALRYEPEACRRVLDLTRGHPFLVQLLCDEIVALKNEQAPVVRRLARLADVEAVVPATLERGSFFFADIEHNQTNEAGLKLLTWLAGQGEGAVTRPEIIAAELGSEIAVEPALALLTRRELVEPVGEGVRFQVELIRRWFSR